MTERDEQYVGCRDDVTPEGSRLVSLAAAPGDADPDAPADFGLEFEEHNGGTVTTGGAETHPAEGIAADPFFASLHTVGPELSPADLAWALGWPAAAASWGAADDPAESAHRNRRGGLRHAVHSRATVRRAVASGSGPEVAAAASETVRLRNLSAGGVSALHGSAMRPGDTFWIALRNPDSPAADVARTIDRRCTVLRCEPGGAGRVLFNVAARFVA
jgi:hypothetical protein